MSKGSTNLVRASVLAPCVRILQGEPAKLRAVFAEAGIPLEAAHDRDVWLPKRLVYRFAKVASLETGDPCFGARAGLQVSWEELGVFGTAVRRAANLSDAGERAKLYLRFSASGASCWVESKKECAWFCYRPEVRFAEGADQAELYDLGILLQFVRLALGPGWRPQRLRVTTCDPAVVQQVEAFSAARILLDQTTTAVGFPVQFLKSPLKWDRDERGAIWLERNPPDGTATDAVRRVVTSLLPFGRPATASQTARMMGANIRNLQRMLAAEGTTFVEILKSVRHRAALDLLETTDAPLKYIADHLGYSSPSNFVRAFKQIAGRTPSDVRGGLLKLRDKRPGP